LYEKNNGNKTSRRGRNFIFGRTFPYRNHQFSSKPNELKYDCPGCKGAKDANPPQDDLRKEGWASDEVTMPIPLSYLDQCAAGKAFEAD